MNIAKMMKQAQQMQGKMQKVQAELAEKEVETTTAGGKIVVKATCAGDITSIKIDPYLNSDAGTMSPFEHGEVFVLDDGGEVDLDLGNYERFLDIALTKDNNITTGKVYANVIDKERRGDYLGTCKLFRTSQMKSRNG